MNWYRIDFTGESQSLLCKINADCSQLSNMIAQDQSIKVEQQLVMFQHPPGEDGKPKINFIKLKDMHPLYKVCNQEYIMANQIRSFGLVDENTSMWKLIKESALGEPSIITPGKNISV
jgi:hypothetical protein